MSKADKIEMLSREKEIQDLIAKGKSSGEICESLAEKYKVNVKSIQRIYYRIIKAMQQVVEQGRGEIRATLIARNDHIYQRALANNNFKVALSANDAIARLAGLDKIQEEAQDKPKILVLKEREVEKLEAPEDAGEQSES